MKKSYFFLFFVLFLFILASCSSSDSATSGKNSSNSTPVSGANYPSDNPSKEDNYANSDFQAENPSSDNSSTPQASDSVSPTSDEAPLPEVSDSDSASQEPEELPDNVGELIENPFVETKTEPVSTFSIDVDTASYSIMRSYIMDSFRLPPADSVRIEELVNYFKYSYPEPADGKPFSVSLEVAKSPWADNRHLVMIGLKGKSLDPSRIPASNLVFLIDSSGSMSSENKLPLLQKSFNFLVDNLKDSDTVSIVTYAGSSSVVIEGAKGSEKDKLKSAISSLSANGSTGGAEGITTAYQIAEKYLTSDGNNRVILATDGDFNVGPSSDADMENLIVSKRDKKIFLTTIGVGMGNYRDSKLEILADKGNGNYFYIDSEREAHKVFGEDLTSNLFTIAKDVKIQVEFNPLKIARYRLIGYENRVMPNQDFNDDTKDAGEIGAGHTVTAFYEVELGETPAFLREETEEPVDFGEKGIMELRMRYKEPDQDVSKYIEEMLNYGGEADVVMSENMVFASSVVEFGMLLRNSKFKENSSLDSVITRSKTAVGADKYGFRGEFLEIVEKAKELLK